MVHLLKSSSKKITKKKNRKQYQLRTTLKRPSEGQQNQNAAMLDNAQGFQEHIERQELNQEKL